MPDRITTDGHEAYPRAIRNVFGDRVLHRTNRHLNNHLEQDHRGIKQRYQPTDETRAFLRPQSHRNQPVTLAQRRAIHQDRFAQLMGMIAAA
jgi:transposase-like protein